MPEQPFENLRRILFIRLDNIGDVVMTGPALRALRQAYPAAKIMLMASPAGSQVAPLLPWVDDLITWRAIWQEISQTPLLEPEKEFALVELLAAQQFDAAFISTSFNQSPYPPAYACYLAQIPLRVGQSNEFGGGLLTHWVTPPPDSTHQVERSLHLLQECGIDARSDQLELRIPTQDQEHADQILSRAGIAPGMPFIALAPGASAQTRRYPEDRFAQAVHLLIEHTRMPLVLIGSQRELGKFPMLENLAGSGGMVSLAGETSVGEMCAVIRRSLLLIANNSGTMHIAAALNRPMVILFSGSELAGQWAPRSAQVRLLNRATGCSPCHRFQCPYQLECLDIAPEEIVTAAADLLLNHADRGGSNSEHSAVFSRR